LLRHALAAERPKACAASAREDDRIKVISQIVSPQRHRGHGEF
jgi:hypothetical protein